LSVQVQIGQHGFHCFSPDAGLELIAIGFPGLLVGFIGQQLTFGKRGVLRIDNNIVVEIEDFLDILQGKVQKVPDLAGQAL